MFKRIMLVGAGFAAFCAVDANAQSITQTFAVNTATPTMTTGQLFNSNLGTLTSVTFANSFNLSGSYTIMNTSSFSVSGSAGISGSPFVVDTDSTQKANAVNGALGNGIQGLPFYQNLTSYTLASGASKSVTFASGPVSGSFVDTTAADLAALSQVGGGTFNAFSSLSATSVVSQPSGTYSFTGNLVGTGTFSITYNYSILSTVAGAAPEPATWGMMILGFGLAGTALRRRRQIATQVSYAV